MTHPAPLLQINDLIVSRGGSQVLSVQEFTLSENETVALIGPNGAGKSTFLLSLASLIPAAWSLMRYRGEEVSSAIEYRRKLAMVFQDPLLFDTTVAENVAAGLKLRGLPRPEVHERVQEYMDRFKIAHLATRSARKLSGGEAQRTSLARAFATRPEMILLDEPFVALDPPTRQALTEDLEQVFREAGTSVIMTTHDREEALRLSDRMIVMQEGRIIQSGPPSRVMNFPVNEFVANFVGMENIYSGTVLSSSDGLLDLAVDSVRIRISGQGTPGEHLIISIHPEHVVISTLNPAEGSSSRNVIQGRITRIIPFGLYAKVYLDCGFTLVATITNESLQQLNITVGMPVYASFKATSVLMFRKG